MSESRPPVRLVVPAETSAAVDTAIVEVAYLAKTKVSKALLTDVLLRVGLRHLEEAAALIREAANDQQ
ncbi:hypothetical protein [Planomonospora sp. ID82291]|uniref:hypothetical protein n=1 Tax=Planomonospora sp. ID82291 TaxID=2738136 RepID=UPI0018C43C56|nr:hypothetical protein [Planomonospora sp. ID82291]MBG0819114.1 hypothetical protein [Planomonospora sp. ID82291]